MSLGVTTEGSHHPDRLYAGDMPRESIKVTIAAGGGQDLKRGDLLGKKIISGDYLLSLAAANDGTEVPDAILAEDIADADLPAEAIVYRAGEFNRNAVRLGTGHTFASVIQGLRERGIYLKKAMER